MLGAEASEAAVKAIDPRAYRVVHFAAHSLVDEEHPDRSAIVLAGGDRDDGLLQTREIADLPLDGHVVVLSACRSATGAVLAGEGVMGLSRAFLEAGARTVVGTLWAIRDDHAAQFFEALYASLGRGQTVGAALTHARRKAIAQGMPASAWSSVAVIGDDTVVVGSGAAHARIPGALPAIAGAALFLAAITWARRLVRRAC